MNEHNKFKKLNRFLIRNGVYHLFYYNITHLTREYSPSWTNERKEVFGNTENYQVSRYLNFAFDWSATQQGHEFWSKLYNTAYQGELR